MMWCYFCRPCGQCVTNDQFPKIGLVGLVGLAGTVGLVGLAELLGVSNFSCAAKAMCFSYYIKESHVAFKTQLFSTNYWTSDISPDGLCCWHNVPSVLDKSDRSYT